MSDLTGKFVWRDLQSSDPEKSEAFYTSLLGWDVDPQDMGPAGIYRIVGPGVGFGGIMQLQAPDGVPSHWMSHIHTPNVDETAAKATELGGTIVVPPTDIPNIGRFSVVMDPQGAAFSLFTASMPEYVPSFGVDVPIGGVAWNELMSKDVEGSKAFYSQLFGYTSEVHDMGTGPYTVLSANGTMVAGILPAPDGAMPSAWLIYFQIANVDESVAKVEELGGQNVSGIIEVPTIGRVAVVTDPVGAFFGLFEDEPAPA